MDVGGSINMKKFLCLITIVLLLAICTGCCDTSADNGVDAVDYGPAFVRVETADNLGYTYRIVYHKDTKVMYVVGHYCDFTVMLDADGKPLLWEGE
jgi:predicted small secreted protein